MPIVKSVEKVLVTLDAAAEPVTEDLTKGQDETQCVPFDSAYWATASDQSSNDELHYEVQIIDNAGTAAVKVSSSRRATRGLTLVSERRTWA